MSTGPNYGRILKVGDTVSITNEAGTEFGEIVGYAIAPGYIQVRPHNSEDVFTVRKRDLVKVDK